MKSSTVRRSALSKESINVIENLANEEENYSYNEPSDYQNQDNKANDYYKNDDSIPNEYLRTSDNYDRNSDSKSKEIDLLWQSFKSAQFSSKSPFIHALGGFAAGVISTLIVLALFGVFSANTDMPKVTDQPPEEIEEIVESEPAATEETQVKAEEEQNVNDKIQEKEVKAEIKTETPAVSVKTKKYIIKDGDTVEAIIKHEYGAYTPERAEAIMKVNNMPNLDRISIDQVLLLPVEK